MLGYTYPATQALTDTDDVEKARLKPRNADSAKKMIALYWETEPTAFFC